LWFGIAFDPDLFSTWHFATSPTALWLRESCEVLWQSGGILQAIASSILRDLRYIAAMAYQFDLHLHSPISTVENGHCTHPAGFTWQFERRDRLTPQDAIDRDRDLDHALAMAFGGRFHGRDQDKAQTGTKDTSEASRS
jgi:hypothetical protein